MEQATFVNEDGEWEGLPPPAAAPEPAPEPAAAEEETARYASLEEAASAAQAAGVTDAVMMGVDMARDADLMESMLGMSSDSTPSGRLSSKQRTAKQRSKLQKSLLRDATQSAQAMAKINAAARAQTKVLLTAPPLPDLRQAHINYLARLTGDPTVDARDGMIADKVMPGVVPMGPSPMKAVGSVRKSNQERLKLSAQIDKKLRDAATECMTKMLTSEVKRQKSLWKNWGWIKGTKGHVEYHALWRGPDVLSPDNYCAFNVVYEDGHLGDPQYICGLAELSRPTTCRTRWALLKWVLDFQLLGALLERLADKEPDGRAPRSVELRDLLAAVASDPKKKCPEVKILHDLMCGDDLTDYERLWLERASVETDMSTACALSEKDETTAGQHFTEAVHHLAHLLAATQKVLRHGILDARYTAEAAREQ